MNSARGSDGIWGKDVPDAHPRRRDGGRRNNVGGVVCPGETANRGDWLVVYHMMVLRRIDWLEQMGQEYKG